MMQLSGVAGPVPPLWRIPLFADGLEECLPARLRPQPRRPRPGRMSQPPEAPRL